MTEKWEETWKETLPLGSCPKCGRNIWQSDMRLWYLSVKGNAEAVVFCVHCKWTCTTEDLVPF